MAKLTADIASYFDNHPRVDTFYQTSDGSMFSSKGPAQTQATALGRKGKNAIVSAITRAEVETWRANPDNATPATAEEEEVTYEDVIVTQDDLDNNPDLVAQGITVGQTIQVPVVSKKEAGSGSAKLEAELADAQAVLASLPVTYTVKRKAAQKLIDDLQAQITALGS
jgi:predicted flavoprotein YhiN